jgi:hypothetical protein
VARQASVEGQAVDADRIVVGDLAQAAAEKADDAEERFRLEVMSAREVCALPDPPTTDELVGPLLVRGTRLVVGGHTGEGKTTFCLQLVRAALRGQEFLDRQGATGGCRALVLDLEQGLRSVKRRLRELALDDCDELDYIRVPEGLALDRSREHVGAFEEVLAAGKYDAVLLDPLYKAHGGDSNAEREAVDLMRLLDALRAEYGFALVLPVHCRKPIPGTKFSIHDLFGSSAYVRGAETVLGLQRVSHGFGRLHYLKDRDGDLPVGETAELLFNRDDGFRLKPERDEEEELREVRERVRAFVLGNPGCSQRKVEERVEGGSALIRRALTAEVEGGAIEDRGDGSRRAFHAVVGEEQEELEWR